jgi:hypothetical protein
MTMLAINFRILWNHFGHLGKHPGIVRANEGALFEITRLISLREAWGKRRRYTEVPTSD